jgi:hypothetical protein
LINDGFDLFLVEDDAFEVLLEVAVDVLEDEVEFVLCGDDFFECDDVGVVEFFEKGDLPDCGGGDAFVLVIESYFFYSNDLVVDFVSGFIDYAVGALADFVDALVALDFVATGTVYDHANGLI